MTEMTRPRVASAAGPFSDYIEPKDEPARWPLRRAMLFIVVANGLAWYAVIVAIKAAIAG